MPIPAQSSLTKFDASSTPSIDKSESEAINSQYSLWPILITLSQLETQCDQPLKATELGQQAQEIILSIADNTGPDLEASFLALPEVRAALEAL